MHDTNGDRVLRDLQELCGSGVLEARRLAVLEVRRLFEASAEISKEMETIAADIKGTALRREEVRVGEDFGAEFDSLLHNDKISDIDIDEKGIRILTTQICIPFQGKRYWIDPVKIEINFDGKDMGSGYGHVAGIRVVKSRADQKVSKQGYPGEGENWPAPHVRGDGTVCLGNLQDQVARALRQHRWTEAIEFIFPFLESCSPEHEAYAMVLRNVAVKVEDDPSAPQTRQKNEKEHGR